MSRNCVCSAEDGIVCDNCKEKQANELVQKIANLIQEASNLGIKVMVCELDDDDVVSTPFNLEYDKESNRIYINCVY